MQDTVGTPMRERVWVEKIDKTEDPPRLVEVVLVENGLVKEVTKVDRPLTPDEVAALEKDR